MQYSGLGAPYSWTLVLGAGQFVTSDVVTGFLPQKGTIYGNALAVFTKLRTFILYGAANSNFTLVPSIYDVGISQSTMQMVSNDAYGFTSPRHSVADHHAQLRQLRLCVGVAHDPTVDHEKGRAGVRIEHHPQQEPIPRVFHGRNGDCSPA